MTNFQWFMIGVVFFIPLLIDRKFCFKMALYPLLMVTMVVWAPFIVASEFVFGVKISAEINVK